MNIVLATNNPHKVKEYKRILAPINCNILTLDDLNIVDDAEETGNTFNENSLIKACSIAKYTNCVIISDDSGIIIDAMKDELGVHSKRFLPSLDYKGKMSAILNRLEGKTRTSRFICVITLLNFKDKPIQFEGICEGHISDSIKGSNGFGYDPIFIPNNQSETMAQMSEEKKNLISHRALAGQKLIEYLKREIK